MRLPQLLRVGADARVQRLRFEHLLTMTAGWPAEQTAQRDRDDDLRQLARRPFVAEPGTRFAYDNGAANLLALAWPTPCGGPWPITRASACSRRSAFTPSTGGAARRAMRWARSACR